MILFAIILVVIMAFTFERSELFGSGEKKPKINHHKIVHAHNVLRDEVGVPHVHWSHELAIKAQEWADSLVQNCSVFRSDDEYGENIFWTGNKRSEEDVVNFWAKEKKWFAQSDSVYSEEKSGRWKHYSQIVWGNTKKIGAAKQKCDNGDEIWVCFYYPQGNQEGEKPF